MGRINWGLVLRPDTVVWCRGKNDIEKLFPYVIAKGLTWRHGREPYNIKDIVEIYNYDEVSCYNLYEGSYSDLDYSKTFGYKILILDDIFIEDIILENKVQPPNSRAFRTDWYKLRNYR